MERCCNLRWPVEDTQCCTSSGLTPDDVPPLPPPGVHEKLIDAVLFIETNFSLMQLHETIMSY